jgi:Cu-processing system permease protein
MMGYTGAIFRNFFGTAGGMSITIGVLLLWIALPLCLSVHHFKGKDL